MTKKTNKKGKIGKAIKKGVAVGAMAGAAYMLLGPDGKKNQKKLKDFVTKVKKEVTRDTQIVKKDAKMILKEAKSVGKDIKKEIKSASAKIKKNIKNN